VLVCGNFDIAMAEDEKDFSRFISGYIGQKLRESGSKMQSHVLVHYE
jgi:hypothetical protein